MLLTFIIHVCFAGSVEYKKHCSILNQQTALNALQSITDTVAKEDCGIARVAMLQFTAGLLIFGQRPMGHALISTVATLLEGGSSLFPIH